MEELSDQSCDLMEEPDQYKGIFLKKRRVGLANKSSSSIAISFRRTTDLCFSLIHQAMSQGEWVRAADLMMSYFQTLEDRTTARQRQAPEVIWRLGNEILLNHPKSTMEDVSFFNEAMKNVGVKNYVKITLEQFYYLVCHGQPEDACRTLTLAGIWRYGKISASEKKNITLIQAYKALVEFNTWLDKQSSASEDDVACASQALEGLLRQTAAGFEELIKYPGIWDPFVLCYVHLLERSGKREEIEKVLTDYAYNSRNPANPNAYVYLYDFLKRNDAPRKTLIKTLEALHCRVPSHKLMLEFSQLLEKSGSEEHRRHALQVLFDLLDFAGWKEDVKAWKCLRKQLKRTLKCDQQAWIGDQWQTRKSWWPAYHFTVLHAKKDCQLNEELAMEKAWAAAILLGHACSYFSALRTLVSKEQKTYLKSIAKFVKERRPARPD
ncbi:TATA box-binding protein-associated factor RNA polymerase I subunit A [Spea bombifrons]|uniref:TATA box-binding protein-associated factor RNA polymerase I subunit A n=1 Tax=Spea bombifrons TaxID=233779 RepID=UPI00234B0697|nr:TATA box-binding protein-associated factor RNA polymerase I subunit A [Spea bombifrons]XP_053315999.1 TATA box-binding protein-associated factor RNA polymerase I subunit A [Spea bombifrons]